MKWEYRIISATGCLDEDQLNDFGKGGWELVTIIVTDQDVNPELTHVHVFKRLKEPI